MFTWIKYNDKDNGKRGPQNMDHTKQWWTNESIKLFGKKKQTGSTFEPISSLQGMEEGFVYVETTLRNLSSQVLENVRFQAWIHDQTIIVSSGADVATLKFETQREVKESQAATLPFPGPGNNPGTLVKSTEWKVPPTIPQPHVAVAVHAYAKDDSYAYDSYADDGRSTLDYLNTPNDGLNSIRVEVPPWPPTLVIPEFKLCWPRERPVPGGWPWPPDVRLTVEAIRVAGSRGFDAGTQAALRATPDVQRIRPNLADSVIGPALQRGLQVVGRDAGHLASKPMLAFAPDRDTLIPLRFSRYAPKAFGFHQERRQVARSVEIPDRVESSQLSFGLSLSEHNRPGDMFLFDIVGRLSSGLILGGTRLVVVVRP